VSTKNTFLLGLDVAMQQGDLLDWSGRGGEDGTWTTIDQGSCLIGMTRREAFGDRVVINEVRRKFFTDCGI
jgi:hypothetical protein